MKRAFVVLAMVVLPIFSLLAQDFKELSRQEKREWRRKQQQAQDSAAYNHAVKALNTQDWVLEAYSIQGQRGNVYQVNSTTNFVMVNGNTGTVQLASPMGAGYNGLGGITVQGNISGYQLSTDKRGNVNVNFIVMGVGINATISITLFTGSNQAQAIVSSNTWGRQITYQGYLYLREDSNVFKGFAL